MGGWQHRLEQSHTPLSDTRHTHLSSSKPSPQISKKHAPCRPPNNQQTTICRGLYIPFTPSFTIPSGSSRPRDPLSRLLGRQNSCGPGRVLCCSTSRSHRSAESSRVDLSSLVLNRSIETALGPEETPRCLHCTKLLSSRTSKTEMRSIAFVSARLRF